MNRCSLIDATTVFPAMVRIFALLVVGGCGGFNTPAQEVSVGLALTSPRLPPRIEEDGHVLVLTRLELTVGVSAQRKGEGEHPLAAAQQVEVPLSVKWTKLFAGPLPRGDYRQLRIALSRLVVDGTWDGTAFRLEASEMDDLELKLGKDWRVELGRASALSLVADPARWMSKSGAGGGSGGDGGGGSGGNVELIDPTSKEAAKGLVERFLQSLAAVRDDNGDGVEDASP